MPKTTIKFTKATGVSSGSFKTRKLPDFAVVTPIEYGTGNSIRVAFDKYNEELYELSLHLNQVTITVINK
jgi:hypothetical protein